jgi:ADP-ribosylglycohydrolase
MEKQMSYPKLPDYSSLCDKLIFYSQLKHEYGSENIQTLLDETNEYLENAVKKLKELPVDTDLLKKEPDDLELIRALRPAGPRKLWNKFEQEKYADRLSGAMLGRFAGCTLGAPVEFWEIEKMELLAKENQMEFPLRDYWKYVPSPFEKRYMISPMEAYTSSKMNGVPVDDDITYTILGLLAAEEYGINLSTEDIGKIWLKYLPYACTAEKVALDNLKTGISALKAGETENPYCEWIGAFIRSDPWGYIAAGYPEKAAELAYKDAYLSHRRQGIYGEMFFAAVIAAGFAVDDPFEAIKIGLTEIPAECAFSKAIHWALEMAPKIKNYKDARKTMEEKFKGMDKTHTINNACLVIWGLSIGGNDFSKVIGETVAMGMDNDCTAATAGSILGSVVGKKSIPENWYKPFGNKVYTYLNGLPEFSIDDLCARFEKLTGDVYKNPV